MAESARFGLNLRILKVLATAPNRMHPSAAIAQKLSESAVMIRRHFLLLQRSGLIEQRRGPNGGAILKVPATRIGIGDIYAASEEGWLVTDNPAISWVSKRARTKAVLAMNETTLAQILKKRIRRKASSSKSKTGLPSQSGVDLVVASFMQDKATRRVVPIDRISSLHATALQEIESHERVSA